MSKTSLIGLMCVRNEAWCLRLTIAAALQWLDHLVILDHASTDDTPDILTSFQSHHPDQVVVLRENNPEWNQATHRQKTLDIGRHLGGTHFAVIDGDELLTANIPPDHIRSFLSKFSLPGGGCCIPWLHLWRSLRQYRNDDSAFGAAWAKAFFVDGLNVNYTTDNYQFHSRFPANTKSVNAAFSLYGGGGLLHLQHVVWDRLRWKQLWYQMQEVVRYGKIQANYAAAVDETDIELSNVPAHWLAGYNLSLIDLGVEPWQAAECRALWQDHGAEKFIRAGVQFFGLTL